LLVSQGVPMLLMGDEFAQSKGGNNNTYCQDSELNWLDWTLGERNAEHARFTRLMIAFRHAHASLRNRDFLGHGDSAGSGYPDLSWHGTRAWQPDWNGRLLAFLLGGCRAKAGSAPDDFVYVAANMYWEALPLELPGLPGLPGLPEGWVWHVAVNTGMPAPEDIHPPGREPLLADPGSCVIGGRSVMILVGRAAPA
jgi:glycogen operon protein